jgi:hypothetical protein
VKRLLVLALLIAGLAPGTWLRSAIPPYDPREPLEVREIAMAPWAAGEVRLLGAWELRSRNRHFHGYSALAVLHDGMLLAASDRGRKLRFIAPDAGSPAARFSAFSGRRTDSKWLSDLEALTLEPATRRIWAAYEGANEIVRYRRDFSEEARVAPLAMQGWPANGGPEAMVRLRDGRFIVLAENDPALLARDMPGLLFPFDPVDGAEPAGFRFLPPEGYRPVDMVQMPDGRVLILLRKVEWSLPPRFAAQLVLADPAEIVPGGAWQGQLMAELAPPLPMDNYEGMAVVPAEGGGSLVWLISDDNQMSFQRTLLLKLLWRPK